jgi:hypothetical protein
MTELPDQFVGIAALFAILTLVIFVDGQHDPLGIHQLIDNKQGSSCPDSHRHRIRRSRRDRDLMAVVAKHNFRVIGGRSQFGDDHSDHVRPQCIEEVADEVVGHWPWRIHSLQGEGDCRRLRSANEDGEGSAQPIGLLE